MKLMLLSCLFLLTTCSYSAGDIILSSQKNPSERVTSFAVTGNTVYFTYIDLKKESGTNGLLKTFSIKSTQNGGQGDLKEAILPPGTPTPLSPISVRVDQCQRLWLLDGAVQNISGKQNKDLPPTLLSIDISENTLRSKFLLTKPFVNFDSFFTTFAIDEGKGCTDTMIYIADFNGRKLIAYRFENNTGRVVKHHFFNPDPFIKLPMDLIFNEMDETVSGIFGLATVGPNLIFHPLASKLDFSVPTKILRSDSTNFTDISVNFERSTAAGAMEFDKKHSVLFYAALDQIGCRKINNKTYENQGDYVNLHVPLTKGYITDLQVLGNNLWILMNNETHYLIETRDIELLIADSPCEKGTSKSLNPRINDEIFSGCAEPGRSRVLNLVSLLSFLYFLCYV